MQSRSVFVVAFAVFRGISCGALGFGGSGMFSGRHPAQEQAKLGMTYDDVRSVLGNPESRQQFTTTYGQTECWYYGSDQVSFNEYGIIDSINSY